jgi:hypothetical protein
MKYTKGITWIEDCRIPTTQEGLDTNQTGRYPSHLLVSDDVLNDGSIKKTRKNEKYKWCGTKSESEIFACRGKYTPRNDNGSSSKFYDLDLWFSELINNI